MRSARRARPTATSSPQPTAGPIWECAPCSRSSPRSLPRRHPAVLADATGLPKAHETPVCARTARALPRLLQRSARYSPPSAFMGKARFSAPWWPSHAHPSPPPRTPLPACSQKWRELRRANSVQRVRHGDEPSSPRIPRTTRPARVTRRGYGSRCLPLGLTPVSPRRTAARTRDRGDNRAS